MSKGTISDDRKTLTFECNLGGVCCIFTIHHMDSTDELNPDKIFISFDTQYSGMNSVRNINRIVIDKRYTKVLSHWFRHAADVMDEWYKEK